MFFGLAVVAGLLSLGALVASWLVLAQLVRVPGNPAANFAGYSLLTIIAVVAMASLVGAITEEVGLRGYMLTRLEVSVQPWLAVVIVAIVVSPGHGITQGFILPTVLWYFVADLMFGALAVLTRSILPGIFIHAIGLLVFFSVIWPTDKYRHVAPIGQQPSAFWIELVLLMLLAVSSLLVFRQVASMTAREAVALQGGVGTSPSTS